MLPKMVTSRMTADERVSLQQSRSEDGKPGGGKQEERSIHDRTDVRGPPSLGRDPAESHVPGGVSGRGHALAWRGNGRGTTGRPTGEHASADPLGTERLLVRSVDLGG